MTSTNKKTGLLTKKLVPLIILISFSLNAFSTDISGNVSGNLTKTNSPYYVIDNLIIPIGDRLTIEPGVEMIFNGDYKITVNGTLQVLGNATDSIIFTAADISTGWLGIDMYNVNASSDSCLFEYCLFSYAKRTGADDCGGAIYTQYGKTRFSHCSFISNTANFRGSAIYANSANGIKIDACVFKNNNTPRSIYGDMAGGAVQTWYCNNTIVSNCLFYQNTSNGVGALTLYMGANNYAINCVMYQNHATYGGGMVYGNARNCIIRENTGTGSEINIAWLDSYSNSNIKGVALDEDPQFIDPDNGDFRLLSSSPCIDAGLNSSISNIPAHDFYGNSRLTGDNIDIGLYEFKPTISTNIQSLYYGIPVSTTHIGAIANIDGSFTYDPPLNSIQNAGEYTVQLSFVATNTSKYGSAAKSIKLTITKAPLSATANDTTKVYGTENPEFEITYTGFVNSEDVNIIDTKATATTIATATSNTGQYDITVTNGEDNNYEFTYIKGNLEITKATPIIVWNTPNNIVEGMALNETQLNATTTIDGLFVYTPEAGTLLTVGDTQPLSVEFIPTDSKNYMIVQDTVYINVKSLTGLTTIDEIVISIYPNPTASEFYIQGLDKYATLIALFDLNGKLYLQQTISNNEHVSVANLPAGAYIVKFETQNKIAYAKLIKK